MVDDRRAIRAVTVVDVLDRVLDKGIVVDAWVMISVVGVDVLTIETRVVVSSFETYLTYGQQVTLAAPATTQRLAPGNPDNAE